MSFSNAEPGKHHYNRLRTSLRPYKNPTPFTFYSLTSSPPPVLGEINSHFVLLLSSPICLSQTFHTMESCAIWLAMPFWVLYTSWHLSPHSILKSELTSPLVQTLWSNDGSGSATPFSLLSRWLTRLLSHSHWLTYFQVVAPEDWRIRGSSYMIRSHISAARFHKPPPPKDDGQRQTLRSEHYLQKI